MIKLLSAKFMTRWPFIIILILLTSSFGSLFLQKGILPKLAGFPLFEKLNLAEKQRSGTTIIEKTEKIVVEENKVLQDIISKILPSVVLVEIIDSSGKIVGHQSGLILTSDGEVLTLFSGHNFQFRIFTGKEVLSAKIKKSDKKEGFLLLEIDKSNLFTVPFANLEKLRLGEPVFLAGMKMSETGPEPFVNSGIIKSFDTEEILPSIVEKEWAKGSPLFNIKGEIIGINTLAKDGDLIAIPIDKIKEFINK